MINYDGIFAVQQNIFLLSDILLSTLSTQIVLRNVHVHSLFLYYLLFRRYQKVIFKKNVKKNADKMCNYGLLVYFEYLN